MKKNMLYLVLTIILLLIGKNSNAQVDAIENLRDSIHSHKNNYIGQSLSKLINDLKVPIEFGLPDNAGSRAKGTAYYQNIKMYLPSDESHALWGFKIKLASPTTVDLGVKRATPYKDWDRQMATILGRVNVVSIDKFQ